MEKRRSPRSSSGIVPKSPLIYEKYKSGCAWSLIGLFDFRQGRSNKRHISDKAHVYKRSLGNPYTKSRLDLLLRFHGKCQCIDDVVDEKKMRVNSSNTNVQPTKSEVSVPETKNVKSESKPIGEAPKGFVRTGKNLKKPRDEPVLDRGRVAFLGHKQHCQQNFVEGSSNEFGIGKTMDAQASPKKEKDGSCKGIGHIDHEQCNEINLQVRVNEAVEALINRKLEDNKGFGRGRESDRSKHFLDALDVLSSNKELFIKLLQDPNSLSVKHIKDLQGSQQQNRRARSSSKATLLETQMKSPQEPEDLERILFLKTGSTSTQIEEDSVHFRFKRMKKKLKHVVGASKDGFHLSSADIVTDKLLHGVWIPKDSDEPKDMETNQRNLPSRIYCDPEGTVKSSQEIKREKKMKVEIYSQPGTVGLEASTNTSGKRGSESSVFRHKKGIESNVYELNRKSDAFPRRLMIEKLERINSLPVQMRCPPYGCCPRFDEKNWRLENEKGKSSSLRENQKPDDHFRVSDNIFTDTKERNSVSVLGDARPRGIEKAEETTKNGYLGSSFTDSPLDIYTLMPESNDYSSDPLSPKTPDLTCSMKLEQEERPSPASVLDQIQMEHDIASPVNIINPPTAEQINADEPHLSYVTGLRYDLKINLTNAIDQETVQGYVKTILEASGLNWTDLLRRCNLSSDQILDPPLFDELPDDLRIMFDYINETLLEVNQRYIKCSPWVSPQNQRLLAFTLGNNLVHKAMKCFDWSLLSEQPFPRTLDQIMEKDLTKRGSWTDLNLDTEDIVGDMVECILEELEMEIVTELKT